MELERVEHPGAVAVLSPAAADYAVASRSRSTLRAYGSDLRHFTEWCAARGVPAIPATPEVVAEYTAAMAERYAPATITRRLAALSVAHQIAGHESPTRSALVRSVHTGVRRTLGVAQREAAPVGTGEVRRMVARIDTDTLRGKRDRALLLVGLALAARRSELVGLEVADLEVAEEGYRVTIRRSKTDQLGRGAVRALPYGQDTDTCPVAALREWLAAADITEGPVFRGITRWGSVGAGRLSPGAVSEVVKRGAELVGIDPSRVSGHSLRAGFVTTAAARGASERAIAAQTGHAPNSPVLRRYVRHASVFTDNAATRIGL